MESREPALPASRLAAWRPAVPARPRPPDLAVRTAEPADCGAIAAIQAARDGTDVSVAQQRCHVDATNPETLLLVAIADGGVVGFARAGRLRPGKDAQPDSVPDGWYLLGLVVVDAWRRRGIGRALTDRRLAWIAERADTAWYFTNARNRASLDLHRSVGFVEVTRTFSVPGFAFEGGHGVLCRLELAPPEPADPPGGGARPQADGTGGPDPSAEPGGRS